MRPSRQRQDVQQPTVSQLARVLAWLVLCWLSVPQLLMFASLAVQLGYSRLAVSWRQSVINETCPCACAQPPGLFVLAYLTVCTHCMSLFSTCCPRLCTEKRGAAEASTGNKKRKSGAAAPPAAASGGGGRGGGAGSSKQAAAAAAAHSIPELPPPPSDSGVITPEEMDGLLRDVVQEAPRRADQVCGGVRMTPQGTPLQAFGCLL